MSSLKSDETGPKVNLTKHAESKNGQNVGLFKTQFVNLLNVVSTKKSVLEKAFSTVGLIVIKMTMSHAVQNVLSDVTLVTGTRKSCFLLFQELRGNPFCSRHVALLIDFPARTIFLLTNFVWGCLHHV